MGRPLIVSKNVRVVLDDLLKAAKQLSLFEEAEHPRHPAGSPKGGQFAPKGGASDAAGTPTKRGREPAESETNRPWEEATEEGERRRGNRNDILAVLQEYGKPMGLQLLQQQTGLSTRALMPALRSLIVDELVEETGKGMYVLPTEPGDEPPAEDRTDPVPVNEEGEVDYSGAERGAADPDNLTRDEAAVLVAQAEDPHWDWRHMDEVARGNSLWPARRLVNAGLLELTRGGYELTPAGEAKLDYARRRREQPDQWEQLPADAPRPGDDWTLDDSYRKVPPAAAYVDGLTGVWERTLKGGEKFEPRWVDQLEEMMRRLYTLGYSDDDIKHLDWEAQEQFEQAHGMNKAPRSLLVFDER
ncbi:MAG: hypothetical protein U9R79_06175 [Armatimonadota bacterium]|nr:hypothetical protein [Armatimonadota bacterium]